MVDDPQMHLAADRIYGLLVEDEDARVCKDIPDSACSDQPLAFTLQLISQTLTKLSDALTSSRLVLAWLLVVLGAPAVLIALLVPIRESLSLLPQLAVGQWVRGFAVRKYFWVAGAVLQAAALLLMSVAVVLLPGTQAAWAVVGLLVAFSLARGICSVAAKDVLGKTVSKSRRGRLTGLASSAGGFVTLAIALAIVLASPLTSGGPAEGEPTFFAGLLGAAAFLWLLAAAAYSQIPEVGGATEGGGNGLRTAIGSLSLLWCDRDLAAFVLARVLLLSTAFSIPYLVVIIGRDGAGQLTDLAFLLFAEGCAGLLSGVFWGRWSDQSAQTVMAVAALLGATVILSALAINAYWPGLTGNIFVGSSLIFSAAVAHQGARVGRKTYLIDLSTAENRSTYTAVSNTTVGIFLLSGGALGFIDAAYGTSAVLMLLLVLAALAAGFCYRLRPVV